MSENLTTWHIESKDGRRTVQAFTEYAAWRLWFGHPFGSRLSFDLSVVREIEEGTKAVKTEWIRKEQPK